MRSSWAEGVLWSLTNQKWGCSKSLTSFAITATTFRTYSRFCWRFHQSLVTSTCIFWPQIIETPSRSLVCPPKPRVRCSAADPHHQGPTLRPEVGSYVSRRLIFHMNRASVMTWASFCFWIIPFWTVGENPIRATPFRWLASPPAILPSFKVSCFCYFTFVFDTSGCLMGKMNLVELFQEWMWIINRTTWSSSLHCPPPRIW